MAGTEEFPRHAVSLVERFRRDGYWNDDTLADFLRHWAESEPDRVAIVAADREISYGELQDQAHRFANALVALGLRRGDAVGIQLPNHPEFLIAFLGVTMMGGVLLTMHMPYRAGEMAPLLNHGAAKAVICGPAAQAYDAPTTMTSLKETVPTLQHVIVVGDATDSDHHSMGDLISNGSADAIADPPVAGDPCLLCFTSGTSAAPKGILRTYESFCANARIFAPEIALGGDDRVLVAPPFTHVFGLCCATLALYRGAANVLMPLFTPPLYAQTLVRGRPSVVFSVPAHVAATLKEGLLDDVDLSAIRDVIIAGSVCPPEVAAALERRLPRGRVGQLFGMTETILIMQTPLDAPPDVRHGTTGRATLGIEMRIAAPENDEPVPTGGEGELQVRGYSIFPGYLNNREATAKSFTQDGWFRSGDLAKADEAGNVTITGRVKDIINRGGIKINPTDIENVIQAHPSIVLAAIVPTPDEVLGERICLFVTLAPGASVTLDDLLRYLEEEGIAKMRWPERLEIIDEMPLTPTRKIVKGELTKRLAPSS